MKKVLRVLVVEDSEDDALLVLHQIKKGGYDIDYELVATAEKMKAALEDKTWDLILSDYIMPHFNGLEALAILKESGQDIPFIVISGTIGEEVTVETMKAGAHDYLMKDNLKRLLPAIERELLDSISRAGRKRAEVALKEQYSTLRGIIDGTDALIFSLDRQYRYTSFNHGHASVMKTIYGVDIEIGHCLLDYMTVAEDRDKARQNLDRVLNGEQIIEEAYSGEEIRSRLYFQVSHSPIKTEEGNIIGIAVIAQDMTQRKHAEEALFVGQQVFRTLVENSPDIIARYDCNCQRTYVNPIFLKVAQIPEQELLSTSPKVKSPLPQASAAILHNLIQRVLDSGNAETVDVIWPKEDNINYWYNIYASPEFDREGKVVSVMTTSRDITKRKHAEEQVLKLNRIYAVLSNINQAIVRIRDTREIFTEACRIAIESGKFKIAWIGMINPQTNKVDVVASNGFKGDYPDKIKIDLNDKLRSSCPTGFAARTGKHKISNNVPDDDNMIPWRANASKYGYQSVASFPLIVFNKVIGTFTIYDSELNSFHEDEINLLDEMANDISFAIEFIETETNRKKAEKAMRESEERYRLIAENTADTISVLDLDLTMRYVSPSVLKLRGYTAIETLTMSLDQIFTPTSLEKITKLFTYQMDLEATGKSDPFRTVSVELEEYCKDGSTIWVETTISTIRDADLKPMQILTVTRDITERKVGEEDRKYHIRFLENLEQIDQAIKQEANIEKMLWNIVDTVFSMFGSDRAWLFYPCDPDALTFRVPVEISRPEYPGAGVQNIDVPMSSDLADNLRDALASEDPVTYIAGTERPVNKLSAGQFGVQSQMFVAVYPKIGKPWAFGIHQCSYPRIWTERDKMLFKEIGRRLGDSLTNLLATRNLRESELRYREIFENTSDLITVSEVDKDGHFNLLDYNPAWEKIVGVTHKMLVGQCLDEMNENEIANMLIIQYKKCVEKKVSIDFEQELFTKTGNRFLYTTLVPVSNAEGNIYRLISVSRDITEQKKAEEGLKEYKTATQQSPASIVITDINGTIEYVNPKFTEISGYTSEEVIGKNPRILKSGKMSTEEYKVLWDTILAGEEWRGEFHNRRKNGTLYWESASISSIKDNAGKIIHFIAVKEDTTQRKLMEMDLLVAKEKAEDMSRLKSSLLLNMSHELRTPMNGILGFSSLLKEKNLDNDSLRMVEFISSSGLRLMATLNSILELADVEAGNQTVQLTRVQLSKIIPLIAHPYIRLAETKKLKLIINVEENLYSQLDERLLYNILQYLLDNAIKFTDTGSISLILKKVELDGKSLAGIIVNDSGIGIPPEKTSLIFDAFRQGSEGIGRCYEGTGLGLTLCKKFVELLNGVITIDSLPDIGSTFTVMFPLAGPNTDELITPLPATTAPEVKKNLSYPNNEKKARILIVEDNEQNCELMEIYLSSFCTSDIVHTGIQAVKHAFTNQYDVILMDINLGADLDGIQATREIRKMVNYKEVPIIAVTGFSTVEEKTRILVGGLDQFLTKPFTRDELTEIVRSVLPP
ncbi:MAG: PAS domain S-box protein [Bacteroidetes bacterium]|nr:PAS domain S-box protein [Bacteroidota bacterium]